MLAAFQEAVMSRLAPGIDCHGVVRVADVDGYRRRQGGQVRDVQGGQVENMMASHMPPNGKKCIQCHDTKRDCTANSWASRRTRWGVAGLRVLGAQARCTRRAQAQAAAPQAEPRRQVGCAPPELGQPPYVLADDSIQNAG
jgi:hypothetical protein